jgi:SAM-dependent methyltransferase
VVHSPVAVSGSAGWPGWCGGGGGGLWQRVCLGVAGPPRRARWGGRLGPAAGRRAPPAGEFGLRFPLVQADAERVPLGVGCAGLVISEYGALVWCDPYRWIPEAARLLRPGGRLVFMAQSTLARMCIPERGLATGRLVRDLFGLHRIVQRGTSGREYQLFTLPHGEWIRLLGRCGLMVEDTIEVQVPPGAANNDFPELPDEWARRWPAEEVWFACRSSAS